MTCIHARQGYRICHSCGEVLIPFRCIGPRRPRAPNVLVQGRQSLSIATTSLVAGCLATGLSSG